MFDEKKNAPGAAGTATEGENPNTPKREKKEFKMKASSIISAATACGSLFRRTWPVGDAVNLDADPSADFADQKGDQVVTYDEVHSTALNEWKAQAEEACAIVSLTDVISSAADPTPRWADELYFKESRIPAGSEFGSDTVRLPLTYHEGSGADAAFAEVQVRQGIRATHPKITFQRSEWKPKNGRQFVEGSKYVLTPEEADQLARLLLLAVDVARAAEGVE